MTTPHRILAGNIGRTTVTFTALPGHGVLAASTAWATASRGDDVVVLDPAVTVDGDTVTVTVDWQVPDDQPAGRHVITVDVGGALEAAAQLQVEVIARRQPALPVDPPPEP